MKAVLALLLILLSVAAAPQTRVLVVAGLGGSSDYETDFQRQAKAAADALREVTPDVTLLLGEMVSRERMHSEMQAMARRSESTDTPVVVLVGHGSYDERDYRFNVPGADVTGDDLARWLAALPSQRQLVVAATSASGALQPLLAEEARTVITATKSGGESNATVFHRYFAESLTETAADADKDGRVSAAEAFAFASAGVAGHYEEHKQMATEHPLLEGPKPGLVLARLPTVPAFDGAGAGARERLATLEEEISALRADKDQREADVYYAELQRLMLEVALLRRRIGQGDDG